MKRLGFFFLFLLIGSLSVVAQNNEKAAIIKVIENEHRYFCERNYEKWAATFDQTENILWGNGINSSMKGWEAMDKTFKEFFANNPDPSEPSVRIEYDVTITEDRAWVACLQINEKGNEGKRLTSLIKRDGEWKIAVLLF